MSQIREFPLRVVRVKWDRFCQTGNTRYLDGLPAHVVASWRRSREHGVDPGLRRFPVSDMGCALGEPERELLDLVLPGLEPFRSEVRDCSVLLTVSDATGRIIHRDGNASALAAADAINAVPGALPRESTVGTNSLGTTLHLADAVAIHGWQHFCEAFWEWSDVGAPVLDPTTGAVLGAIDLGLYKKPLTPAFVLAVKAMVGTVQAGLAARNAALARAPISTDGRQAGTLRSIEARPRGQTRPGGAWQARFAFDELLGASARFLAAKSLARKAARTDLPVLLRGETGTGKELFAHAIHAASARAGGPFVTVNCGAIPPDLIASELFGYEKGAFTGADAGGRRGKFELADGGTIFLDEITETSAALQISLLRVLEDRAVVPIGAERARRVDVRVVSATNRALDEALAAGALRRDLYYRLKGVYIELPPLRERSGDIPLFVSRACAASGRGVRVTSEALERLASHDWPGNLRELNAVVGSAAALAEGALIGLDDLPPEFGACARGAAAPPAAFDLDAAERETVERAMRACDGRVMEAAQLLGIGRSSLYRKLARWNLTRASHWREKLVAPGGSASG